MRSHNGGIGAIDLRADPVVKPDRTAIATVGCKYRRRMRNEPDTRAVRAWAAEAGINCPQRGAIPAAVTVAYNEAHGIERVPPAKDRQLPLLPGHMDLCSLVVRTDYTDDASWREVMTAVKAPTDEGFVATIDVCEDRAFDSLAPAQLVEHLPNGHRHRVLFIVDAATIRHPEHPLVAVDLQDELGREFRLIPSCVQSLGDNMNLANMWFHEFANHTAADGVFRGFAPIQPGPGPLRDARPGA